MSPFLKGDGKTYNGRFHDAAGRRYMRSLGTRSKREATLIETWGQQLRTRRDWRTLSAIIAGRVDASTAYYALLDGSLGAVLDALDVQSAEASEPDLDTLVGEWATSVRSAKYVVQVRTMIPAGRRFPVSQFTRRAISAHLAALGCADPTKNRYRVALSQFARWLVEREILPANPVRDVRGFREHDPRMVFYTREEARAVVQRVPFPQHYAEALMVGAGLEWGAVVGLHRRDVDLETREVQVRGTKTRWRTRTVRVTEAWAWLGIPEYLRFLPPDAPIFPPTMTHRRALAAHKAACEAAGVTISTLHDWRHTYAIQALRDGLPPQTVKRQLGHSPNSTMLERVYGAWLPKTDEDYRPRIAGAMERRV